MAETLEILIVEDSPSDRMLIKETFKSLSVKYNLYFTKDGIEAMSFLNKEGEYKGFPEPSIVFLDLNLPKKSGYEVLQEAKSNINIKHIPIIILSTSDREVLSAYTNCANSYLKKPLDYLGYIEMMKSVENFWFHNAKLPANLN